MKILVIKPSSLGDVIHALPFLNSVKESFPTAEIDWVISKSLKGLLEDNPLINDLIVLNKDSWKNIRRLPKTLAEIARLKKQLKKKEYNFVVDLQGLLRSGLIAFSTHATQKVGFADSREGSTIFYDKKLTVDRSLHAVDKCLEAAKAIGANLKKAKFPLNVSKDAKERMRELLGDTDEYIVIVPSARWASKRWPAEKFAALIKKTSFPCVIAGTKGDRKISKKIIDSINKGGHKKNWKNTIIDLCGKTDLKELTALLAGAEAVVSNDSGPMHIAAALNKPVVAIFGPTDPVKTGPYGWQTNKKLTVIKTLVSCGPCRNKNCADLICMEKISSNKVMKALKEYL
ncbi:lipopolysaccharide heptosyltransferase 1 [bacterium BMS3Abin09]|nr:lipopolysaccharide heptosyltransferase 1 [bacterium BMS3Abin09]GBE40822.1 lipopolysaccharide heptosyltransferase 1 [bacterium BMS3Bbin09]